MVDLTSISAALSSLKFASDIAKTMVGLRDAQAFNSKMIEFQSAIIDAQNSALSANEERAALVERVGSLEKEVANLKAREAQKDRYELQNLGIGAYAHMLKPKARGTEPPHRVCTHCFQKEKFLYFNTDHTLSDITSAVDGFAHPATMKLSRPIRW